MQTEYVPHGYIIGDLLRQQYALDVYEAVRAHDQRAVYINRIKRDALNSMELVDMELSIRHLPFVSNPYINKCLSVQRHNASMASYVIVDRPSSETLGTVIRNARARREHIPEAKVWYIMAQLLYGLASIHDVAENQRLRNDSPPVHMDIRPSHVYVTNDGNYLLSIFSPSKFLHQASTEPIDGRGTTIGLKTRSDWTEYIDNQQSPPKQAVYTAPEWFLTGEYTAASDIWALGALMHEVCTFEPLFAVPCDLDKVSVAEILQTVALEHRPIPSEYSDILRCTLYYMTNVKALNRPQLTDLFEMRQITDMLQLMNKTPPETFVTMPSPSSNPFISRMKTIERLCETPDSHMSPDVLMDILDLTTPTSAFSVKQRAKSTENAKTRLRENEMDLGEAQAPVDSTKSIGITPSCPRMQMLGSIDMQPVRANGTNGVATCSNPYDDKTMSISELNPDKANSLILAVESGNDEKIRQLILTHAGRATLDGRTALMVAVEQNNPEIVRLLAPKEAKMALKAPEIFEGETALMQAARRGQTPIVTILAPYEAKCTRQNGQTALMIATQANKKDTVDVLIHFEHGLTDEDGWTSLKIASNLGFTGIVETLAAFEAGIADDAGETSLMVAANKGYVEIVNLLKHAEIKMQTGNGQTALMCAAHKGHTEVCKILALGESGLRKADGTTALMCAAYSNSLDSVSVLLPLEEGLQTNEQCPDGVGRTALVCAIEQRAIDVVRYILENSEAEREKSMAVSSSDGAKRSWIDLLKEIGTAEAISLVEKYAA